MKKKNNRSHTHRSYGFFSIILQAKNRLRHPPRKKTLQIVIPRKTRLPIFLLTIH